MFDKNFRSIMGLKQYMEMMGLKSLVYDKINFLEGFVESEQFHILEVDNTHLIFRDSYRKQNFIIKELGIYSCGKYNYTIEEYNEGEI